MHARPVATVVGGDPGAPGRRLILGRVPLFSKLPDEQLDELARHASTRTHPRNTLVISEGDLTDSMYVIASGRVRVFLADSRGKEVTLASLGPFEYFGEIAPLDDSPRSASVLTVERSTVLVIEKRHLHRCLASAPDVTIDVIKMLASRVRSLNERARTFALKDVQGRVSCALLDLATIDGDELVIPSKPTQQDLANFVGASREMVSRVLKDLVADGYLSVEPRRIVIHKTLPGRY